MRGCGVKEQLIRMIERVYEEIKVKFKLSLREVETEWCDCTGVRQGCPLSPLLFNIYVRQLGMRLDGCKNGVSHRVMNDDGTVEKRYVWVFYMQMICVWWLTAQKIYKG